MFIFGSVLLLMTYVTYKDCGKSEDDKLFKKSPFDYVCGPDLDVLLYWVPQLLLLFINVCFTYLFGIRNRRFYKNSSKHL